MKFRTAYDRERCSCPSGSRYRKLYTKIRTSEGASQLMESGVEDVYDSIQKAADGRTIEDLVRRARAGDSSAIPAPVDSYPDLSHAPKDMLEAHQMLASAREKYLSLPTQLRGKFGNSFEKFLESVGNGTVFDVARGASGTKSISSQLSDEELEKVRAIIGGNNNA